MSNNKSADKAPAASATAPAAAAAANASSSSASSTAEVPLSKQQQTIRLLRSHVFMIRKGVVQSDPRLLTRVLRQLTAVRAQLTAPVLRALTKQYMPALTDTLQSAQASAMTDSAASAATDGDDSEDLSPPAAAPVEEKKTGAAASAAAATTKAQTEQAEKDRKEAELLLADVPEVDIYIQLLLALYFFDKGLKEQSVALLSTLFAALATLNRRSLDTLSAKIYSYYALLNESLGRAPEIRNQLLLAHRTACLQHNEPAQAALSVCILRNYLSQHLYAQADTFRLKSNFPDQRSNAQTARYCYYIGKIQAVQLHYSDAFASLTQALRKAPQRAAIGFRQVCTKLLILVQLLMGDIPERALFSASKDLRKSLLPYLALTQAVRVGDLGMFNAVMTKHKAVFDADGIESLIVRLRSNVIKAGLRKINLAYSKISLADICAKLGLTGSQQDAEYMIAKAIHDGVIDATIDRAGGFVLSKEVVDVYSTNEPQVAYHKRIQFTMEMHAATVKSLRYPTGTKTKIDVDSDEEDDEDTIAGNAPDKREEDKKKDA